MATAITLAAIETFLEAGTAAEARTALGLGTGDSPQFTTVKIGGTDVILKRLAAASCGVYAADGTTLGIMNAKRFVSGASTTASASLNIPSGTAPTTPVNGDIWSDGSDILVRLGGTTYTLDKT